jgi:hypothetical protein
MPLEDELVVFTEMVAAAFTPVVLFIFKEEVEFLQISIL